MNRTAVHPAQRCACHGRVKQSCFTLIELLVVIAIITILPVQNF